MTKTELAFKWSAESLYEAYPKIYFWTFTFIECMPDWYYPNCWKGFARELHNQYGGTIKGLRVIEMHPDGHGLHFHCLINQRVSCGHLRKIGARFGLGRNHVRMSKDAERDIEYCAKYLAKQIRRPFYAKMQKWGTIGGFRGVRLKDIRIDSPFTRAVHDICRLLCEPRLPYPIYKRLEKDFDDEEWTDADLAEAALRYSRGEKFDLNVAREFVQGRENFRPQLTPTTRQHMEAVSR